MTKLLQVKAEDSRSSAPQITVTTSGGYSGHEFMAFYLSNG
jgi:hypothetical protein